MVGFPAVLTPEMLGSMGFLFCLLSLSVLLLFLLLPSLFCSQESFQCKTQNRAVGSRFPLLIFQSLGSTEPPQEQYEPLDSVTCTFWNINCSMLLCQAIWSRSLRVCGEITTLYKSNETIVRVWILTAKPYSGLSNRYTLICLLI